MPINVEIIPEGITILEIVHATHRPIGEVALNLLQENTELISSLGIKTPLTKEQIGAALMARTLSLIKQNPHR